MKALIDADILRYEIGFGAERGIKELVEGGSEMDIKPSMAYIEELLTGRIYSILDAVKADDFCLYLSKEDDNKRKEFATLKPYKGQRESKKPYQFENMTTFITSTLPNVVSSMGLEADDMMAIDQIAALKAGRKDTVIVSRDKDLLQIPGYHYGWSCGRQDEKPLFFQDGREFGEIDLSLKGTLTGHGLAFFYAQMLMGDSTDNIQGVPKVGPKKAYNVLSAKPNNEWLYVVASMYRGHYGIDWYEAMEENGKLLWLVRRFDAEDEPAWYIPGEMKEEIYHGQELG